jgi:hypothetical protein
MSVPSEFFEDPKVGFALLSHTTPSPVLSPLVHRAAPFPRWSNIPWSQDLERTDEAFAF